eukprot:247503-Prorocentrum_minimum.AAC.2
MPAPQVCPFGRSESTVLHSHSAECGSANHPLVSPWFDCFWQVRNRLHEVGLAADVDYLRALDQTNTIRGTPRLGAAVRDLSLIHISEPTRRS